MNESTETVQVQKDLPIPSKKTKDQKRLDRRREELRLLGIKEERLEGILAMEEFRRLPINEKVDRLIATVQNAERIYSDTIQGLANEMIALRQNQEEIADAFDINLRGLEKMLIGLGVTEETQKSVMESVTKEFMAKKAAIEAAKKDPEKAAVESELAAASKEESATVAIQG